MSSFGSEDVKQACRNIDVSFKSYVEALKIKASRRLSHLCNALGAGMWNKIIHMKKIFQIPSPLVENHTTRDIEPTASSPTAMAKGVNIIAINVLIMGMLNRLFRCWVIGLALWMLA